MAKVYTESRRSNVVNALSSLKVYSLQYHPHYLHPNNTLFLKDTFEDGDEPFTPSQGIRSTYPVRLHLSTDVNAKVEENIVLKLIQQKNDYLNDVAKLTGNYKRSRVGLSKKGKDRIYSMHLNNLMELTTKDPDPFFFGSYNWYYTGGTLDIASIFDVEFLFYVSGEKLNIFNSAVLSSKKEQLQLDHLDSTNQIVCDTIFEVTKSNDNNYVAARQKRKFTVFYLQEEMAQQDFQCERSIPFMSGAFIDKYFFTIDANRIVQRHDMSTRRECGQMYLKLPTNQSYWCQLKAYNNQLIFADENTLKIYDSRLFAKKASKCLELGLDSVTEKCEVITCVQADANENNLYVSTTHNLFVFDIRYGMESGNQLARYTHQMKTPPLMIDASGGGATGFAPNERLIALSGTFTDDIAIAQHIKSPKYKLRNNNIPQKIQCLSDVYKKLQENSLQSEANNLYDDNRPINIGTRFVRINSKLFLLSEKSSGEIFYQQITEDESQGEHEIDEKLFRNLDLGHEDETKSSKVTTITNFSSVKRILNYNLLNDTEVPDTENLKPQKWQLSIEQLSSYKDLLSSDLLSVWNEQQLTVKEDKTDKSDFVNGWVNKSSTEAPPYEEQFDAPNNSYSMF